MFDNNNMKLNLVLIVCAVSFAKESFGECT